ncbi:MAG: DEAD/DEAH box helicase [Clostridia bacterium]|nr:DEAD/DEAH box helicase [Clostridia bacterium]
MTTEQTGFAALGLSEPTLRALEAMGFTQPTPIQTETIPLVMDGRDVIAKAPTGTGKTCAFGIPLIECLNPDMKDLQALVLCPTRELCEQITADLRALIRFNPAIRIASVYGGQSMNRQVEALKKHPHIVVATPGRLLDHMSRGNVWLGNLYTAVLDEADEMLKMGFIKDVRRILNKTPGDTQVVMFSATISREVMDVAWEYQHDAVEIQVASEGDSRPRIDQYLIASSGSQRMEDMLNIIRQEDYHRVMVFANMKCTVRQLTERLQKRHGSVDCLHGDMPQSLRNKVMAKFRENKLEILVATDVAARGIDVEDVEAVFNYDIPEENEYYLHRIGRTGRAKRQGAAYTFMTDSDKYRIRDILKYTRSQAVEMAFDEEGRLRPAAELQAEEAEERAE